ncbi:MAG TPA: Stp1/IreP family PP2C-type Ser/Thr phosphatase [Candidatus Polarisedimenticolaceae bacterium]|nr:Stp1/IreP family PP2C-type Ser/Thr phosphatase [Candidatus Polarisedimenticolaceae bacterium]
MSSKAFGLTDVGRLRENNQDNFLVDTGLGVYAVADGMGGHAAGEVASRIAIEALGDELREDAEQQAPSPDQAAARLKLAFQEGNRRICESVVTRGEWRGMGTTIVAMLELRGRMIIGHVGDSRAYLLRDGRLRRLTSDHSWVNEQVRLGLLSDEEAQRHPMRNIVTRALGNRNDIDVEVTDLEARADDVYLLCSDGLNTMLEDGEILELLQSNLSNPQQACRSLIERANLRGGEDNVTVVVVRAENRGKNTA